MRDRTLQAMVCRGWTISVPALAAGIALESARLVGIGAWSLFAAISIATIDNIFVVARTFRSTRASRGTETEGTETEGTETRVQHGATEKRRDDFQVVRPPISIWRPD